MRESILQIVKYSENRKRYDCNVIPFFVWRKPRNSRVVQKSLLAMRQTEKLLSIIIKVRSANCTEKSKGGH